MTLTERINDTNAAPWVIEEIRKLEAERDALAAKLQGIIDFCDRPSGGGMNGDPIWDGLKSQAPETNLARLKAECWKEAYLAGMEHGHHLTVEGGYVPDDEEAAEDYVADRQAEGGE